MTRASKLMINMYKNVVQATELQVKKHSPHLSLSKFYIDENTTEKTLHKNMNDLVNYIKHPYYSYLYLKKNNL